MTWRGRDLVDASSVGNDGDRVEGVEDREVGEVTSHPLPLKKTAGRPEAHRAVLPLARQEHGSAPAETGMA
jgi:hypothetical protein